MGQNEILAVALLVAPIALMLILRTNATLVFLTLCLGFTVNSLLGADIGAFATLFVPQTGAHTLELVLILLPALMTALFMVYSVKGLPRMLLNVIPAVAVGGLAAILVVPLLPPGISQAVLSLGLWKQMVRMQSLIIGAGAVVSMLFLWLQRVPMGKDGGEKKRES